MRLSIFTPSHDTRHLEEAYRTLKAQSFDDWEWVIVLNDGAKFPEAIDDARVRILTAPEWLKGGVGALKRFACEHCEGDVLVELDHDDLLAGPEVLAHIGDEALKGAEFIYSDFANFREDGTYELYDKGWGWEHYTVPNGPKVHQVNRAFDPNPSTLREIFYAPNHVRAWKTDTYRAVGGHDAMRGVCDDFDLVIRTYLAGVEFAHIPECLYLYRLHANGDNTWVKRNAEIQAEQATLGRRYTEPLIHEWCRREGLLKLDLGGAAGSPEGFTSLDLRDGVDLRQPWPYAASSIGAIRAYDFLEHIPHCRDSSCLHRAPFCTVGLMNEIHRVLAPGGWLLSATPSTDGRGAFQDPTHCSFWNPNSFWYYTRSQQRAFVPGIKARFQAARVVQDYPSGWHAEHKLLYVYADLVALKGQRQPGRIEV